MYFSAFDQFFLHGELNCNFNMVAVGNQENKQTSSKGYCKTKGYPKKIASIYVNVPLYTLSAKIISMVIGFFVAYRQVFFGCCFRVPAELLKSAARCLQEIIQSHKIITTREYLLFMSSVNCSRP